MNDEKSARAGESVQAPLPRQKKPARRILVVDDEVAMRLMVTTLLVGAGYDVEAASDGAVGWEALQANSYDLMITDNHMPKVTGLELVAKLRGAGMALPVIMATGTMPAGGLAQDPSLRITATLIKPFAVAELLDTVRNALRVSHQSDEAPQPARVFDQMAQALEYYETDKDEPLDDALNASEVRYRRLFETARDGILILNADTGQIDDVNPFLIELLGYTREQFLGHKLWEIGLFKDTKASQAGFEQLQQQGYVRYENLPLETSTGKSVNVEFVSNVYRASGSMVMQCNVRDITARKEAEDKRQQQSRKLQMFSRRLVEAQETERRNVSRKLRDEVGQTLTLAQLNLQGMLLSPNVNGLTPRMKQSLRMVEFALEQVQNISLDLRPSILDHLGLEPALRWYTIRQAAMVELKVELHFDWLEQRLDPVIETECFRVAQEALTNVTRHAQASTVAVNLHVKNDRLHLSVRDDGVGFDVASVREQAAGGASRGLLSMEERAGLAGGGLEFKSAPGQGTEVQAWFPLTRQRSLCVAENT